MEVSAHSRKLASALWEMSQKVSRVTEVQRGEVETLLKERREESEVRGCCPLPAGPSLDNIVVGSCLLARVGSSQMAVVLHPSLAHTGCGTRVILKLKDFTPARTALSPPASVRPGIPFQLRERS